MKAGRAITTLLVVGGLQALAVVAYLGLERSRKNDAPFAVERLSGTDVLPSLELEDLERAPVRLEPGRPRLVHFWATWCPPCRRELPSLLAIAADFELLEVVAVSADDGWEEIARFFDGEIPPQVLRLREDSALQKIGAITLPDTYLVSPAGQLVARFAGEREWTAPAARRALSEEIKRWK